MKTQREANLRYHVPKNQCYEGSAGRQSGNVHLHVTEDLFSPPLVRKAGATLCGKRGWYERELEGSEIKRLCPLCVKRAGMYGVAYPPLRRRARMAERSLSEFLDAEKVLTKRANDEYARAEAAEARVAELEATGAALLDAIAYDDENPCGYLVSETERIKFRVALEGDDLGPR